MTAQQRFCLLGLCLVLVTGSVPFSASASDSDESALPLPESVEGVSNIHAEELAQRLMESAPPLVIDARIAASRDKGFIDGSIHLADIDTNCSSLAREIPHKGAAIVFYCSSQKCGRSLNAIRIAQKCGYSNLLWFRGGFEEWKAHGFPYVRVPSAGDQQ
jgi:rhodanese-related sulfurtransferase